MNKFVLLCCVGFLANFATARPDLSLGYKYNQGYSSSGGNFLQAPSSASYQPSASGNSYFNAVPSFSQGSLGSTGGTGGGFGGGIGGGTSGSFGGGFGNGIGGSYTGSSSNNNGQFIQGSASSVNSDEQAAFIHQQHVQQNQQAVITKHFYQYLAPEDHDEQQIVRYINIGQPRKNYNVVFIDAPSSSASKAKIIANVAPREDKTAIYVLAKKANALDISTEVVTPAPQHYKPEVFFIKYKTPEEAVHAQHTIQAQYDALGGSSDVINAGTIPVSSVIGSLGGSSSSSGSSSDGFNGQYNTEQSQNIGTAVNVAQTGDNTQQTYLPPAQNGY